ncbi:YhdP family protein [Rhodoferax sp.]|uniref:YhdP family protein n=1 Tax=Rhodoferax sp. TaxID=50421 RepID=UPI0025EBCF70|nr:YhdP family protein [Rhodoferax sp.]
MNDLISAPSLRLRVFAVLAKWALRLLAMGWVAIGLLWCGLHFLIVPRIAEFRPWVESQATEVLGLQVRIGDMRARSNGVIPSIELLRLTVLDQAGRDALVLPSVSAAFSPRSLLSGGLEQLHIDGAELDIRRSADGKWWVAGLPVDSAASPDSAVADWLFSQPEIALVQGKVTWTDETRPVEPVTFEQVNLVLRNRLRGHALRLDANPPAQWGERLSLRGLFRQPLLSRHEGQWQRWDGQVFADFPRVNLLELGRYVDLGVRLDRGQGGLRAWVDVANGTASGAIADVSLAGVHMTTGPGLEPLALSTVSGRLGFKEVEGGREFSTEALQFVTDDGLHWPGGNVTLQWFGQAKSQPERGTLVADKLDMAALAQIAGRLPLQPEFRAQLTRLAPEGMVDEVQASWTGAAAAPASYKAKGRVSRLHLPACRCGSDSYPGIQGLNASFELDQSGGKANLSLQRGVWDAYGLLDEPEVFFEQLSADVQWKLEGSRVQLSGSNVRFANADGAGELQFKWTSPAAGVLSAFNPGVLDLQGTMSRLDGARLYRYLPTAMERESHDYLKAALLGGTLSNGSYKVKGDLARFPFRTAQQGEFRIAAAFQNGSFAFAPPVVLPKDSPPWPGLTQLQGDFLLDKDQIQVKLTRGTLGSSAVQIGKADVQVNPLYDASAVTVNAEAKGPLTDILTMVNSSPLNTLLDKALSQATATGAADYKFKLAFPVADVEKATVQGAIVLGGNDVQIRPDTPKLTRARGTINFSETGFSLAGAQARALGGDVRIEGGLSAATNTAANPAKAVPMQLRFSGTVSADGLRQARELAAVARLAHYATGTASYNATLGFRSGLPELQINSSLAGLALNLPAPLGKPAEALLPLRLELAALRPASQLAGARLRDRLQLDIGRVASVVFVRDQSGPEPHVLSGAIGVGLTAGESAPLPDTGVVANLNIPRLDVDAWIAVVDKLGAEPAAEPGKPVAAATSAMAEYLPTVMVLRSKELVVSGRQLNNVVVGGGREGPLWRANLDATELSGYMEYRQPSGANAGRLYARLARLSIEQSSAQDVESLLDEQPAAIPALDIEVEDFVLRGKRLGRIDIEAVNLGSAGTREWRLNRFNIQTPEADFSASGNWAAINASAAPAGKSVRERRRTVLNFKLDLRDSGELLSRLGMTGVVRKGSGKVEGQVAWAGSPITVDYPSMSGKFNVNVETGQFLKAEPGIAKLLGVLSLQSLPRRLMLDFRDVFSEGFAFDYFRGDIAIEQGVAKTNNLQMKGVNAAVLMDGQADIAKETQNLRVVVVPEINAGSASLIASAINPVVGLSTFLAQLLLRGPLVNAATQEFVVDGTWLDPKVTQVPRKP